MLTVEQVESWSEGIAGLHARFAHRFSRSEPRERALDYLAGLLAPLERKNGWTLSERFVPAWSHTAFFGAASVVASGLVEKRRQGAAIAFVFTGLSLANVLGIPIGTLVGQTWGWRGTFLVISALGALGLIGLCRLLPPGDGTRPAVDLRDELAVFRNPRLWLTLAATAIGFGGLFASFTFVEPILITVTGFSSSSVVWLLALYGMRLVTGNWISGRTADRALIPTTVVLLITLTLALAAFTYTSHNEPLAALNLFVLGACGFGLLTPTQAYVLRVAGRDSPLVATANTGAFGAGITMGSLLGAGIIGTGAAYTTVNLAGAAMTALGLAVLWLSVSLGRRRAPATPAETAHDPRPAQTRAR